MDAELQVLAKVLIKLGVVILVLSNLSKHFKALLDNVLANNLHNSSTQVRTAVNSVDHKPPQCKPTR